MHVKLLAHTPDPEKVIATAAKLCYSNSDVESLYDGLTPEKTEKFLDMLMSIGHESPIEHVSFTFGIEGISRSCSHQLVRHRIASYCIAGDTVLQSYNQKMWTVAQLYDWQFNAKTKGRLKLIELRSMDEDTHIIVKNKIKQIYKIGERPVYRLTTESGRSIKCTQDHAFFSADNKYVKLKDLSVGDSVYINGLELLENEDWLRYYYLETNHTRKEVAEMCGCCETRVKKAFLKYNILKPHSAYPNRKPGCGKKGAMTAEGRKRISDLHKGSNNPAYKHNRADLTLSGAYIEANRSITKLCCAKCGATESLEIHHKDKNPRHNTEDNLIVLCSKCHHLWHKAGTKATFADKIIDISYVGIETVYDVEMQEPYHNFNANGIIVHNCQKSQRYVCEGQFEFITPPAIESDPDLNALFFEHMMMTQQVYEKLRDGLVANHTERIMLEDGVSEDVAQKKAEKLANEDARFVLPNACETKIIVTMNVRSLFNFFRHRCCNRAQWELRAVADEMLRQCKEVAPHLFANAGPSCVMQGKCPEGKMTCGKFNEVMRKYKGES